MWLYSIGFLFIHTTGTKHLLNCQRMICVNMRSFFSLFSDKRTRRLRYVRDLATACGDTTDNTNCTFMIINIHICNLRISDSLILQKRSTITISVTATQSRMSNVPEQHEHIVKITCVASRMVTFVHLFILINSNNICNNKYYYYYLYIIF